jgi:hypothetical protein
MDQLNSTILDMINRDFQEDQRALVTQELSSIKKHHVMAESDYNLENTRASILTLAKGNLNQVITLTKAAKIDFRDVILWAMQDNPNT